MSDALNFFPARIEIGVFKGPDDKPIKVYASPEFTRALASVFDRIGGAYGLDNASLEVMAGFAQAGAVEPSSTLDSAPSEYGAQMVARLQAELAGVTAQLDAMGAQLAPLLQRLEALELQTPLSPVGADWEHPGQIGAKTANTGAFTGLSASEAARFRNVVWTDRATTAGNAILNFSTADAYDWQIYTDVGASPAMVFNVAGVGEAARWNAGRNLLLGTTTDGMTAGGSLAIAKDLAHRGSKLGVFNTAPVSKQTVTGSRGGNVALASLLTALAAYGEITDSSTV